VTRRDNSIVVDEWNCLSLDGALCKEVRAGHACGQKGLGLRLKSPCFCLSLGQQGEWHKRGIRLGPRCVSSPGKTLKRKGFEKEKRRSLRGGARFKNSSTWKPCAPQRFEQNKEAMMQLDHRRGLGKYVSPLSYVFGMITSIVEFSRIRGICMAL
jgi:hypothetical protein